MKNGMVSVIIPVYNVEKYLERCLDSIINQTYQNLEIILVNDGSPDNCGEICDKYALKDGRIRVIHQKNSGVSAARNNGIAQSCGEYIVFVDSDDYVSSDYIRNLMDISDADYVASGCYVQTKELAWNEWHNREITLRIDDIRTTPENINYVPTGTVWAKRYKRSILQRISLQFNTIISRGEDTLFNAEYLLGCQSISVLDISDYYYCYSPNAATLKYNPNLFKWSMQSLLRIGILTGYDTDVFYERVWNNATAVCTNLFATGKQYPFSLIFRIFEVCNNHYVRRSLRYAKDHGNIKYAFLVKSYLFPLYLFLHSILYSIRAKLTPNHDVKKH